VTDPTLDQLRTAMHELQTALQQHLNKQGSAALVTAGLGFPHSIDVQINSGARTLATRVPYVAWADEAARPTILEHLADRWTAAQP
jgi:hypothetical protein